MRERCMDMGDGAWTCQGGAGKGAGKGAGREYS